LNDLKLNLNVNNDRIVRNFLNKIKEVFEQFKEEGDRAVNLRFRSVNNLIILSDEIYSELSFDEGFKSISSFCPEKTIISTGLSKWCGAGGWRLGYFIVPDSLNILEVV
jgi:aspartate/methionine/tyrosine aminotransferase